MSYIQTNKHKVYSTTDFVSFVLQSAEQLDELISKATADRASAAAELTQVLLGVRVVTPGAPVDVHVCAFNHHMELFVEFLFGWCEGEGAARRRKRTFHT